MAEPVATLYGYWRSSAAYRVRIALALKGVAVEHAFVHLAKGEQNQEAFRAINPMGLLPYWQEADGFGHGQSLAIIEALDEAYPEPPLLPAGARERAAVREIAYTIACDIHPLQNLWVMKRWCGEDMAERAAWAREVMARGFAAVEHRLRQSAGRHAVGDQVSLADICIVPQLYNARRYEFDLAPFPRLAAVDEAARALPAFAAALPENQPDKG